jgi:acyl-[acyl-carrier-protein]-phospholipid O-acyltransferase/long-chain-fatty-acid--[acyl-carrier-protein] ligase
MVPHEALEQKILTALGLEGGAERAIAIAGVADESKGEAVVLLSAVDINLDELRTKLRDSGVPNLWIPKKISRVETIPILASGKLDLGRCKELAAEK